MSTADLLSPTPSAPPFALPPVEGYTARWVDPFQGFDISVPGGSFFYAERFFNERWSDLTLAYLQEDDSVDWRSTDWRAVPPGALDKIRFTNMRWRQDRLKLYGKSIPLPRWTAWYGDPGHAQKIVLPLRHGTLLVMRGSLQHHWQHAVPKRMTSVGSRFNLTFRTIRDIG